LNPSPPVLDRQAAGAQERNPDEIVVCMNAAKLLDSLHYAFSNRYTVVTELLQNARRAKASRVAVDYDPATQTLAVRDDGIGIADWQQLVTVGASGWDATVVRDEHALGMGFMKSLYSARRCTVQSRARMIAFDTAAALRQRPIEVRDAAAGAETSVTLEGVLLPEFARRVAVLASAFPIPVVCNGAVLPRPLALDARAYVATAIGQVHLAGTEDGRATTALLLVLQGLVVYGDARLDRDGNVVHLDARRFRARLPDRDMLVDEAEAVQQVEVVLKALWRDRLAEAKRTLASETFVARFFAAAVTWGASDLLADVPLLPGRLFARIAGYPVHEGGGDAEYLQPLPGLVRQEQFASGELRAVMLPAADRSSFAYWMFAKAKGLLVLTQTWGVGAGHWLWEHVRALDERPVAVTIIGARVRTRLHGQWVAPEVVLCATYRVRLDGEVAELTEQALAWSDGGPGGPALIVVPDGERSGAAVLQCSSYRDEDDHWCAEPADHDRAALARLIGRLRAHDPTEAMRSLLGELRLEHYPCLQGRTFSLQVGAGHGTHQVRLVAGPTADGAARGSLLGPAGV
jgi:hypothetical protein